jgi:hypothetical protein
MATSFQAERSPHAENRGDSVVAIAMTPNVVESVIAFVALQ